MPNVFASAGSFTVTSATQFTVTDATAFGGSKPKGVLLWTGNHAVDTVSDHAHFGSWGCTQNDIVGAAMRYRHAFGTSAVNRTNADGNASVSGSVTILADTSTSIECDMDCNGDGIGSNPGPITDGWRFDVTSFSATSITFNYLLLGGDDLEVTAISRRINNATEPFAHNFSKTDRLLGWTWDGNETTDNGNHTRTSIYNSYGCFATNNGGSTFQQWAVGQREVNGSAAQDIVGIFSNTECSAVATVDSGHTNSNTHEARVTALDSTDITVTRTLWPTASPQPILFMFVISIPASMNVWAGNYTLPTSGGTFTPSSQPGFQPDVYGIMASGHTTANDHEQVEGSGAWSFGIQDQYGNHKSASIIVEGEMLNIETTYARSLTSTKFLDQRTVSSGSESIAAQFDAATFIGTGIEVSSPVGTFGGLAGAFAFETATTTPIDVSVTDTLSFTDASSETIEFNVSVAEVLSLVDTILGEGPFTGIATESLVFTDQADVVSPFFLTVIDNLVFGDAAAQSGIEPPPRQRGGRTIETVRQMRAIERMQVLARQDQELLKALKRMLRKER